jgi:hypothetical protein
VSGVIVSIRIDSLQAEKTGQVFPTEELFFDVNAKLEEQKKNNDDVVLNFSLLISTKPNVVRYSTAGSVTLEGKAADVKKKLEANPKTKIPQILFTVYQHVFNSIYMLSSILNTPYPPPDLLHPMAEKIQIVSTPPPQPEEKAEAPAQPATQSPDQQQASAQPPTQQPQAPAPEATAAPAATTAPATAEQPAATT